MGWGECPEGLWWEEERVRWEEEWEGEGWECRGTVVGGGRGRATPGVARQCPVPLLVYVFVYYITVVLLEQCNTRLCQAVVGLHQQTIQTIGLIK